MNVIIQLRISYPEQFKECFTLYLLIYSVVNILVQKNYLIFKIVSTDDIDFWQEGKGVKIHFIES